MNLDTGTIIKGLFASVLTLLIVFSGGFLLRQISFVESE